MRSSRVRPGAKVYMSLINRHTRGRLEFISINFFHHTQSPWSRGMLVLESLGSNTRHIPNCSVVYE
jgi:hypothetical protein